MPVLHVGASMRWWLEFALGALFATLWARFAPRRDVKTFLNAARWLEAALPVAAAPDTIAHHMRLTFPRYAERKGGSARLGPSSQDCQAQCATEDEYDFPAATAAQALGHVQPPRGAIRRSGKSLGVGRRLAGFSEAQTRQAPAWEQSLQVVRRPCVRRITRIATLRSRSNAISRLAFSR
jgi:hypothetical protein